MDATCGARSSKVLAMTEKRSAIVVHKSPIQKFVKFDSTLRFCA